MLAQLPPHSSRTITPLYTNEKGGWGGGRIERTIHMKNGGGGGRGPMNRDPREIAFSLQTNQY